MLKARIIFSVLHICQAEYSGGTTGLTDFFGVIVRPSISQRNCCSVRLLTSDSERGHWKFAAPVFYTKEDSRQIPIPDL